MRTSNHAARHAIHATPNRLTSAPLEHAAIRERTRRLVFMGLAPMVGDSVIGTLGIIPAFAARFPHADIEVVLDDRVAQIFGGRKSIAAAAATFRVSTFSGADLMTAAQGQEFRTFDNYFTDSGSPIRSGEPSLGEFCERFKPMAAQFIGRAVFPRLTPGTLFVYSHDDLWGNLFASITGTWSIGASQSERFSMKMRPLRAAFEEALAEAVAQTGALAWDFGHSVVTNPHYTSGKIYGDRRTLEKNVAAGQYNGLTTDLRYGRFMSAYDFADRGLKLVLGQSSHWQVPRDFLVDPAQLAQFDQFLTGAFTDPTRSLLVVNLKAASADNRHAMKTNLPYLLEALERLLRVLPHANVLCLPMDDERLGGFVAERRLQGARIAQLSDLKLGIPALARARIVVSNDTGCVHLANVSSASPSRIVAFGFNDRITHWSMPQNHTLWSEDGETVARQLVQKTLMAWLKNR